MSEIKVGEYIRDNTGVTGKVIAINENPSRVVIDDCGQIVLIADIVKYSKNIIDLIEVGDAIKYKELRHFSNYETIFNKEYILGIHNANELKNMKKEAENNKIKVLQIYTKEQLKCIGYEVKGE